MSSSYSSSSADDKTAKATPVSAARASRKATASKRKGRGGAPSVEASGSDSDRPLSPSSSASSSSDVGGTSAPLKLHRNESAPLVKFPTDVPLKGSPAFKLARVNLNLHLLPLYTGRVRAGVREILNSYLMKFMPACGGIVVGYDAVHVIDSYGRFFADAPHIHFRCKANFLVFAPELNGVVRGVVTRVSPGHIGLLVAGTFNAAIKQSYIPTQMHFDEAAQQWFHTEVPDFAIGVGSTVCFINTSLDVTNDVVQIHGSLLAPGTGPAGYPNQMLNIVASTAKRVTGGAAAAVAAGAESSQEEDDALVPGNVVASVDMGGDEVADGGEVEVDVDARGQGDVGEAETTEVRKAKKSHRKRKRGSSADNDEGSADGSSADEPAEPPAKRQKKGAKAKTPKAKGKAKSKAKAKSKDKKKKKKKKGKK